jgi:hypothetical protein
MKISKILAIATLAVAAGQSFNVLAATANVCAGGGAASATPFGPVGEQRTAAGTDIFVQSGFTVQCSNNVAMNYNEVSATIFGVAAASVKGNQVVGGNSNGGAIKQIGSPCPTTGCTAALVDTATTDDAVTGAGSS